MKKHPAYNRFSGLIKLALPILLCMALTAGCARMRPDTPPPKAIPGQPKPYKVLGQWYQPISHAGGFQQDGIASWYGDQFHGKKTSNGEIYDMHAMTAAHKTLPLGTWVRVYNKKNEKEVVVRINDRGPFVGNRIIDLSYTAAKKLDMVGPGTAPVIVVALGASKDKSRPTDTPTEFVPVNYDAGTFTFQVGAFKNRENAERLVQTLSRQYENAHISRHDTGQETFYRVRVGKYTSLQQIMKEESLLAEAGFTDSFIVAE
ncbi:MAG: septal ring lytic transglycosylase RlpA family protein [Desulfobacteraceae bacterium]|nr:MAG: septal ring lytic transglycosylase RlpA family protein [Desulfobacteraceae bacterium]